MTDESIVLVWYMMSRRSREEAAYQKSFRRRLRREIRRYEWNRMRKRSNTKANWKVN
ncbi:hypothetical protein F441_11374 [Phytophthora nicotianae CJ01A1]|uniref:Uncharacterized protein n=1 Tax=Phytophthora nicotianae CJ01A1 TaxID=1317063 RepID=W2WTI8_PHYNI|nr:hypothetical protein F441_11374 [Phytophthora nicotianae CJ01A1]